MTSQHRPYRDESRKNYGRTLDDSAGMSEDDLKIGALLRIADATEKMAQRHTELIADRDRYERWYRMEEDRNQRLRRQCAALKGQITKLKKKGGAA